MKTLRSLSLLITVITVITSFSFAETLVFDGTNGLAGWDFLGSGNAYNIDDGGSLAPMQDLVSMESPANTNNFGLDGAAWGWDAAKFSPSAYITPESGAWAGARFEAPAGYIITGVNIPKAYFNVGANMAVAVADGEGNIVAQSARSASNEMVTDIAAAGLSTTAVEIRWVNTSSTTTNVWANNGVIISSVEVALELDTNAITTEVFAEAGLEGWEYIGSGTAYDVADGGAEKPFNEIVNFISPANTNDFGTDGGSWGWDAGMFSPVNQIQPNSGAYVGARYTAAEGKTIISVSVPKMYFNVGTSMVVQMVDDAGNVLAQTTRAALTEMVTDLTAEALDTSFIELRWVNTAASTINLWGESNAVIFNTVEVSTADDPDYDPFDPIVYENPSKPSTWYGYYHAYTDFNNWGNAFPEVGSFTNLNHVFPNQGATDAAVANHSYMLVDTHWQLFEADGSGGYQLKSNYEDAVSGLVSLFNGYEEYVGAFSPIDEPYHRNVSQADLETAIAALKEAFPGVPVYVNFAPTVAPNLTAETLPAGADWLAFDLYESGDGQPVQIADIQAIVNHMKSIKLPEQKLFIIPPSAMNLVADYTDQQLADSINDFYSLMQSDDEIIGMMVFPADGCRQEHFDGAGSTIPLALAAQQAIGSEIAGEVCGDIWNGFYKFDYNRDCHVDLIDFAAYGAVWSSE
ncbi:hypothetical protein SMSP2_02013 [Limihaloglobus sulfuriphilus]|uniref:Uncharacterized protein n=1 Tax=Limihaloglobus sulfuriphilus TaxID=1851148 RepID=A0A1Q2MG07_9BACT|nr:hypothetical protein [Limihaloglobus sulfuriphilus]AQQ71636.1 hypothetical protein SMSP2_02013 [Limihaloglobus sulfuriphilus]